MFIYGKLLPQMYSNKFYTDLSLNLWTFFFSFFRLLFWRYGDKLELKSRDAWINNVSDALVKLASVPKQLTGNLDI